MLEREPPDAPQQVAGFRFGATEREAKEACTASRGVFVGVEAYAKQAGPDIAPAFACATPQLNLPFLVAVVVGYFCGSELCEIVITGSEPGSKIFPVLEEKYGAPIVTRNGPTAKCKPGGPRRTWLWSTATSMGQAEVEGCAVHGRLQGFHLLR